MKKKFSDLLNSPLPSKSRTSNFGYMCESSDDEGYGEVEDIDDDSATECGGPGCPSEGYEGDNNCFGNDDDSAGAEVGTNDISDISDDDDFDIDDLSAEDLAALDSELRDDALSSVIGDDDDDEIELSADEEMRADDMMNMAATTLLVKDELNTEEKIDFIESHQANVAIDEGFMTEADVNELSYELGLVKEGKYDKKMVIRLDAAAKKKQLYALAINVSAAAKNDPDYIKLRKVMRMRKVLRAKLARKYHAEATKRMKVYFARLKKSKSGALSKIGEKLVSKKEHDS